MINNLGASIGNILFNSPSQSPILVVDSNPDNLELTVAIVNELEYSIVTASDGFSALKMVKAYNPQLILLDLMLPRIDGIKVIQYIRATGNFVPAVALTSIPKNMFQKQAFLAGCNEYIEKPFDIDQLKQTIIHYLQKSS